MADAERMPWYRRRETHFLVAAIIVIALLASCLRQSGEPENALLEHLIAARDSLAIPDETVEAAAALLATPDAIAEFMSLEMAPAYYRGRLYSPQDAFTLRMANESDAAVMMHALMTAAGHEASLAVIEAPAGGPADGWKRGHTLTQEYKALADYVEADMSSTASAEARLANMAQVIMDAVGSIPEIVGADGFQRLQNTNMRGLSRDAGVYPLVRLADGRVWRADGSDVTGQFDEAAIREWEPEAVQPLSVELWARLENGRTVTLADWVGSAAANIALSFQPVTGAAAFWESSLSDTVEAPVWVPLLQTGTQVVEGRVFDVTSGAIKDLAGSSFAVSDLADPGPAPVVTQLGIVSAIAHDTGRISVRLEHDAADGAKFSVPHVRVDRAGQAVPFRIEAQAQKARPLVVLIDRSGSMTDEGRIGLALAATEVLLQSIGNEREVAVVSFDNAPRIDVPLERRASGAELLDAFRAASIVADGGNKTGAAVAFAQDLVGQRGADFVLLNDADTDYTNTIPDVLARYGSSLHTVGIKVDATPYDAVSTTARRINSAAGVAVVAEELADTIGGGLRLSFAPAPETAAGEQVQFTVSVAEHDVSAQGTYRQPEPGDVGIAAIGLSLQLGNAGKKTAVLGEFGNGSDLDVLLARHRVIVGTGAPRDKHLARRLLDGWITIVSALEEREGRSQTIPDRDGTADFDSLAIGGQLRQLTEFAGEEGLFNFRGPILAVQSIGPAIGDGTQWEEISQINVLAQPGLYADQDLNSAGGLWLSRQSSSADMWAAYAALAGAEAATVGGQSVPRRMVEAGGIRYDWGWYYSNDPNAIFRVARSPGVGQYPLFKIGKSGAKGARARRAAAEYQELLAKNTVAGHVASGFGTLGGVQGAPLGGIVGFMTENVRQYCHAAVHLGFVTEVIAGEDTETDDWGTYARKQCGIEGDTGLAERYMLEFLKGFAAGYAADVYTMGVHAYLSSAFDVTPPRTGWGKVADGSFQGFFLNSPASVHFGEMVTGIHKSIDKHYFGEQ